MPAPNSTPNGGKSKAFPWRQALLAAGVFAVLIMSFGSIDLAALGVAAAIEPWWLLLLGLLAGLLGFTVVICEWLAQKLFRRLGVASVSDVFLRSDF